MICVFCKNTAIWLLHGHLLDLNINNEILSIGVIGRDGSELFQGKAFGGYAIFYRKSPTENVLILHCISR